MRRTTEQWEALLDGATPGPWEAREDHGGMNLFAGGERVFGSDSCGDVSGADEDVRLAAHAPAAVAEVVRLRREIESLRAECEAVAKDPRGHELYTPNEVAHLIETAHYNALTRILEGEENEHLAIPQM